MPSSDLTSGTDIQTDTQGTDLKTRQMFIQTIRQIKKRLLPKDKILELDEREIFPEQIIRELLSPEIGLQLLFIPEQYGGIGGSAQDCCAVTREMAKICLGISTAFFAIHLGIEPIMVGGSEAQKSKWLSQVADGKALVAYAVTEPEAGSNVAGIETHADIVYDQDKNITGYRLNGAKQFISNGTYADYVTLLATAPSGPSFFIIEKGTPGFEQGKGENKHGIRASNTASLYLNDVFVPIEQLVGGVPGQGLKQANQVFGHTRLMVASMAIGAAESALSIAMAYARKRIQFGSYLYEKQGYVNKLIVPNMVKLEAASAYIEQTAKTLDQGQTDLSVEGAIAKLFATEAANKAAEDAIQALGGYGYISEFEVEKIKRDVRITTIYEGTSEIMQNIVSMFRWKTTRKTKCEFYNAIARDMENIDEKTGDTGSHVYAACANALNKTIMLVNDHKMTKSQSVLFLLADMITHVEVGASLARKAFALECARHADTDKISLISKIFASFVSEVVARNIAIIVYGQGKIDKDDASRFMDDISYHQLQLAQHGVITAMDALSDILFRRKK